jgi:AcrR family transcriptional regulator
MVTQAMLIDAAEQVFLRHGFEGASVELITEEAGFSRGAFYSNFADKEEVALAVVEKRRRTLATALRTFHRISDANEKRAAVRDWFARQWREREWIALRVDLSRRARRNGMLEGRLAELCREEIRTIAESFATTSKTPLVTALSLIAAFHGLGSMGFHAAPDLDALSEAAAGFVFDRVTGPAMTAAIEEGK